MSDPRWIDDHYPFDLHNLSSMRRDGQMFHTDRSQTRLNRQPNNNPNQKQPKTFRFQPNDDVVVFENEAEPDENTEDENSEENKMGKDSGCTNCVSVFNILLGLAILGLWIYGYFSNYTGKVILLNFAAGAWAGGLIIISGTCTFIYSCVWNNCMGICALSFNIFVITSALACAGISAMDAFVEYRIYKDENYIPPSINVTYIIDVLKDAVEDGDIINTKNSNDSFEYDGAIVYALITLCCLLVSVLITAWNCYFCFAEDNDDDDEEESIDEDEYTNKRDNVSVRSPFTNAVPRGQVAEDYHYGRGNYNPPQQQYPPQARQNFGYYDDDYSLQPQRNVRGYLNDRYQPPHYEEQESPMAPTRGWGNRDRVMNGGHESLYNQRAPQTSYKPRTKHKGTDNSNLDFSRHGIPRASSRYYAESVPEHRPYGRDQYSQERAYSIDGNMGYNTRRDDRQFPRRSDLNSDRSWMYNYY